jgi:hypothetical protein
VPRGRERAGVVWLSGDEPEATPTGTAQLLRGSALASPRSPTPRTGSRVPRVRGDAALGSWASVTGPNVVARHSAYASGLVPPAAADVGGSARADLTFSSSSGIVQIYF